MNQSRLRILFLASSPADQARLRLGEDERAIRERLRSSEHRDRIEVTSQWAVRHRDLQEALLRHRPHVVHFSGHGERDGIMLEDDRRRALLVPASVLARVFCTLADRVRLVLFNTCYSAEQAAAVTEYIDVAIGVRDVIDEEAATGFAASFYMGLAYGRSVHEAFEIGQNELVLAGRVRPDPLCLVQRRGVDAASVVLLDPQGRSIASADTATDAPEHTSTSEFAGTERLHLPWRPRLPKNGSLYNLLSWRYRLADQLIGRDAELAALLQWARDDDPAPRLHWLCGPGGIGKSRLAAELCERLRGDGWRAGFIDTDGQGDGERGPDELGGDERDPEVTAPHSGRGVCMVLDYPEEHRRLALTWMRRLRKLRKARGYRVPVRMLVLSRREFEDWEDELQRERLLELCDEMVLPPLSRLRLEDCLALFREVAARYAGEYGEDLPDVPDEAIVDWHDQEPTVHGRPLFVMAAAVSTVLAPGQTLGLHGGEIVRALVQREAVQLDRLGEDAGLGERTASTLCGLAAVTAGLDGRAIRRLADPALKLGLPGVDDAVARVAQLTAWHDRALHGPSPDIVAAGLLRSCLEREPDPHLASERLWAVMAIAIESGANEDLVERLERLCFDADVMLGRASESFRLGAALVEAVAGKVERARILEKVLSWRFLASGLTRLAACVSELRVEDLRRHREHDPETLLPELASSLDRLASDLAYLGRTDEALSASQESVEILRALAKEHQGWLWAALAAGLDTLSSRLADARRVEEALDVGQESVEIYRGLVQQDLGRWLLSLSWALVHLSLRLSNVGRRGEAVETSREAVELLRQQAQCNFVAFSASLAACLDTHSHQLADVGLADEALESVQESVAIGRQLARENPGRFLSGLSRSLNNLSLYLSDAGNPVESLAAIREAVEVDRRLVEHNPGRFLPDLAIDLGNLSYSLSEVGLSREALESATETVALYRQLEYAEPGRYSAALATSLEDLSRRLARTGRLEDALEPARKTVEVHREMAQDNRESILPFLTSSLQTLASRLARVGHWNEALEVGEELLARCREQFERDPSGSRRRLVDALHHVARSCDALGRTDQAERARCEAAALE